MFTLSDLPYAADALEPHISAETMKVHHGKHHGGYVAKLNELLDDNPLQDISLEEVIKQSHGVSGRQTIFNNAAQIWNHEFYWTSLRAGGGGNATGEVSRLIKEKFGSDDAFSKAFSDAAAAHFGSGWIWLVLDNGSLEIVTTHDADLPLVYGWTALTVCDLWEHAYYLDRQNRRPEYVEIFLDHLIDWDFVNMNLATAKVSEAA